MNVPLSELVPSRRNPRRVKPEREAHRRLVASIRAHGLLEPLIVRPENGHFEVIAGHRRLAALRVVYKGQDVKVPCVVKKVDAEGAEEISVAENFIRERTQYSLRRYLPGSPRMLPEKNQLAPVGTRLAAEDAWPARAPPRGCL